MADIFISYAKEDLPTVKRLAEELEAEGWSVWWDRRIPPGKTWRQVIGKALEKAGSVLVLWSRHSVESRWVLEEADVALNRGILIPILIEDIIPPLGFTSIQAAKLSDWEGNKTHIGYISLLQAVVEIVGPPQAKELERKDAEKRRKEQEELERKAEEEKRRKEQEELKRKLAEERWRKQLLGDGAQSKPSVRPQLITGKDLELLYKKDGGIFSAIFRRKKRKENS